MAYDPEYHREYYQKNKDITLAVNLQKLLGKKPKENDNV